LPDCLDVRVNAGYLGKTRIFNTRNYSYYGDGVRKIIENIRKELAENKSGMAYFSGVVKLKNRRKNDGNADNYYVEYILYINDIAEGDDTPIDFDLPKGERKKVEKVRDYLAVQFKELQKEKRKRKRAAKKLIPKKPSEVKKETTEKIRVVINALKSLVKSGVISKDEFEKQKETLLKFKKRP
jgi:primosomal protein N'